MTAHTSSDIHVGAVVIIDAPGCPEHAGGAA